MPIDIVCTNSRKQDYIVQDTKDIVVNGIYIEHEYIYLSMTPTMNTQYSKYFF